MGFTEAVQHVFQNYANFNGRALRSECWWWALFTVLASVVLSFIDMAIGSGGLISGIFGLATLVPSIAVGARRLHDRGKSGWMQLIGLIPVIGWIYIFIQYASAGDPGPNKYGPPFVNPNRPVA